MSKRKKPNIYREAVKHLDHCYYSCNAILSAPGYQCGDQYAYKYMFALGEVEGGLLVTLDDRPYLYTIDVEEAGGREWRETALLFAAAMRDTGDL